MLAAERGHLEAVRALLQRQDIDIAAVDKDGLSALELAKKGSNDDVVAEIGAFRCRKNDG
jgi:ankyrin repeat protein